MQFLDRVNIADRQVPGRLASFLKLNGNFGKACAWTNIASVDTKRKWAGLTPKGMASKIKGRNRFIRNAMLLHKFV